MYREVEQESNRMKGLDKYPHHAVKSFFRYCATCPECKTNELGIKICAIKKSKNLDCIGIHTAFDGTALNCPKK